MYLPKHFAEDDPAILLDVMQRHTFATLVSVHEGLPVISQVPLLAQQHEDGIRIEGHVARANPHWKALEANAHAVAIFHGPHAYISPRLFINTDRVPTWNYVSVHASGPAIVHHDAQSKRSMLERLVAHHEPSYQAQLDGIDVALIDTMFNAIVSFEIRVDKLEGKFKLGQHRLPDNKPEMQALHEQGSEDERALAQWMKRLGFWQ